MSDESRLLVKLRSPKASIRYEACEELRVSSAISPEALSALLEAMNDADSDVADAAKRAFDTHTGSAPVIPTDAAAQYPPMLSAAKALSDPALLDEYPSPFLILFDQAAVYPQFDNLNRAICMAAERGWRALSISNLNMPILTGSMSIMYVLLEHPCPRPTPAEPKPQDTEGQPDRPDNLDAGGGEDAP